MTPRILYAAFSTTGGIQNWTQIRSQVRSTRICVIHFCFWWQTRIVPTPCGSCPNDSSENCLGKPYEYLQFGRRLRHGPVDKGGSGSQGGSKTLRVPLL